VDNIIKDIKAMGLQHEPITYTSDYFDDIRVPGSHRYRLLGCSDSLR
jgi:hypothetical protein